METHIRTTQEPKRTLADWANENRQHVQIAAGVLIAVVLLIGGVLALFTLRSNSAQEQFAEAMRIYQSPLVSERFASSGEKAYSSSADRAKDAFTAFSSVADKYGMTTAGKNAKYMAGISASEAGQTSTAESLLKQVAGGWCKDRAALAKMALAHLYQGNGNDAAAIAVYQQLIEKPTVAVPAGLAQIQLAELYDATNRPADAKKIYAQLKDKDAKSAAGEMAAQRLGGQPQQ